MYEKDHPVDVWAMLTAEVVKPDEDKWFEPWFTPRIDSPYQWTIDWEDDTTCWDEDKSTLINKSLSLNLPCVSELDSEVKVKCKWPRGKVYVEVTTPHIIGIPFPYTILQTSYLKDIFKAELAPGQPVVAPPVPEIITEGDECDVGGGLVRKCLSSCEGDNNFSIKGLCNDDATGLVCCLSSVQCLAFDWGIGGSGICREADNCPQTSSGQFLAMEDDCPGDNNVKCCLSDVQCRTKKGCTGSCRPRTSCPNTPTQFYDSNLCPGNNDIKCCLSNIPCEYNGVKGICQHTSFCSSEEDKNRINAKWLCPGDKDIRCCLPNVGCSFDIRNDGMCRKESNCFSSTIQIPADGTGICPEDIESVRNVCCLSNVGCESTEGKEGNCVDPTLCPITNTQFPVSDGDCPYSISGPSRCCLSDVSCETQHSDAGQCKDESFCESVGTQIHVDQFCPLTAGSGVGCCLSDLSCMTHDGEMGFCKTACELVGDLCEWDVPGTDCPGAPEVACYVPPKPEEWRLAGTLDGANDNDEFGQGLAVSGMEQSLPLRLLPWMKGQAT